MKRKNDSIVLIGFMGCGKTTVGLRLSWKLKLSVDDTDKLLERRAGKSIRDIFAEDGEDAFRKMETELLFDLKEKQYHHILSVGGGMPVNPVNRGLLKEIGTVVYLRIRPETVYERLKGDDTRPLLQCENPLEKIKTLLESRKEAYEACADIIVDVDGLSVDETVLRILEEKQKKEKKMKLLVINGPNLNFLGIREKSIYGTLDFQYLMDLIAKKAEETGCEIDTYQSNHEGAIIDRIQEAYFDGTEGIVINPGAYTHYSYAIRDALASITVPKVEIHISDITDREEFRKVSVTAPACNKQIYGHGLNGYLEAIDYILQK